MTKFLRMFGLTGGSLAAMMMALGLMTATPQRGKANWLDRLHTALTGNFYDDVFGPDSNPPILCVTAVAGGLGTGCVTTPSCPIGSDNGLSRTGTCADTVSSPINGSKQCYCKPGIAAN